MNSRHAPTFQDVAHMLIADGEARVAMGQNAPSLVRNYKDRLSISAVASSALVAATLRALR